QWSLLRSARLLHSGSATTRSIPMLDPIGNPPRFRIPEYDPGRRVVASTFHTPNFPIHASIFELLGALRAEQQQIDAKTAVAFPALTHVIPVCIHRSIRMKLANSIHPALIEQATEGGAAFWLNERILRPRLRRIDIPISRNDIVVASQDNGHIRRVEVCGVSGEAVQPSELVAEFRTGLRISVWGIDGGYDHPFYGCFDVPTFCVADITWQLRTGQNWCGAARKDRDAIPALLAPPDSLIARAAYRVCRELRIRRLEFLKADH